MPIGDNPHVEAGFSAPAPLSDSAPSGNSSQVGRPSIVCLHGFGQRGDSWDAVAALLAQRGWSVVAPDLPQLMRGADDPFEMMCDAGDLLGMVCDGVASLVCEVLRQTKARPILVGYSMGGRIALETVLRRRSPDVVDACDPLPIAALVLESAGLGPSDEDEREKLRYRNLEWAARVRDEGVVAFMDWWESLPLFASQRAQPADIRASLRAGRLRNDSATLALELVGWGQHAQTGKVKALDGLSALASQGIPVAYFAGGLDRKYCAVANEFRAAVPAAKVRIFSGVGHNVHLEAPGEFARALADWCENPLRRASSTCE